MRAMIISNEQIAERAFQKFLERGGEHGRDVEDWLKSEEEIRRERSAYEVVLLDGGQREIELVRAVRDLTGKSLRQVQTMLEELPRPIKRAGNHSEAQKVQQSLEKLGAKVELRAAE